MKKPGISLLLLAVIAGTVFSQTATVNISGHVKDPNGKPLTNTLVRMGLGLLYTTTDSNGYYMLGGTVNTIQPAKTPQGSAFSQPVLLAGKVLFSLPRNGMKVRMSMYDLEGRFIKDVIDGKMAQGNYAISAESRNMSSQFYVVRLSIDGVSHIMKFSSVARGNAASVSSGSSMPEARLEKLAAIVDTLHATEPGYSLGVTTIQTLTGTVDFQLTKTSTWDGDTVAFWGDTAKYSAAAKAAGHLIFAIVNKTNGTYADSEIWWANGDGGVPVCLKDQPIITNPGNGRTYIMVGYNAKASNPYRPMNKIWDWEEHNTGATSYNGNLTRVDYYGAPLTFRLHSTDGTPDLIRGEPYHMFFQTRQSVFDEFMNEVPWMWDSCAIVDAPWKIVNPCSVPAFETGGSQAHYWDAYEKQCGVTAGACVGINDPVKSSGLFRHVLDLPLAQQKDWNYHYKKAPCSFYAYFIHRRAFKHLQYAFPYDDCYEWSSFVYSGKAQWLLMAIGH